MTVIKISTQSLFVSIIVILTSERMGTDELMTLKLLLSLQGRVSVIDSDKD
jgi:hypothetical protein